VLSTLEIAPGEKKIDPVTTLLPRMRQGTVVDVGVRGGGVRDAVFWWILVTNVDVDVMGVTIVVSQERTTLRRKTGEAMLKNMLLPVTIIPGAGLSRGTGQILAAEASVALTKEAPLMSVESDDRSWPR